MEHTLKRCFLHSTSAPSSPLSNMGFRATLSVTFSTFLLSGCAKRSKLQGDIYYDIRTVLTTMERLATTLSKFLFS